MGEIQQGAQNTVLLNIASHSYCRFVISGSMMWISCSITAQKFPIWLRSIGCWGRLDTAKSVFKKRAGDDSSFVSWCVIRLKVAIRRCYTVFMKGWTCSETTLRWTVYNAQVVLKGSKCGKKMPVCTFIMLEASLWKEINTVDPVHTDLQVF